MARRAWSPRRIRRPTPGARIDEEGPSPSSLERIGDGPQSALWPPVVYVASMPALLAGEPGPSPGRGTNFLAGLAAV